MSPSPPDESARAASVNVPVYAVGSEGSHLAAIGGELAIQNGCLVIENEQGAWAVTWPAGTEWSDEEERLLVGETFAAVGDRVVLGGGEFGAPEGGQWTVAPTEACLSMGWFWKGSDLSLAE